MLFTCSLWQQMPIYTVVSTINGMKLAAMWNQDISSKKFTRKISCTPPVSLRKKKKVANKKVLFRGMWSQLTPFGLPATRWVHLLVKWETHRPPLKVIMAHNALRSLADTFNEKEKKTVVHTCWEPKDQEFGWIQLLKSYTLMDRLEGKWCS